MSEKEIATPKFGFMELFRFQNPYTRQRYWGVMVCSFIANVILSFIVGMLAALNPLLLLISFVLGIAFTWIFISVTLKRLRDTGLSLYWTLLSLIPILNLLTLILYGCLPSSEQKNTKKARGVIALITIVFLMFPILAVAAYLVYNNAEQSQNSDVQSIAASASLSTDIDSFEDVEQK